MSNSFVYMLSFLVMLVIANASDVVPGCGLVTAITLGHVGCPTACGYPFIFLAGDLLRNHFEVHHIVAPWSLVALSTVERSRGRMLEFSNSPTGCGVALGAVFAEEPKVPVLGGVASRAVECFSCGTLVKFTGDPNVQPSL